MINQTSWINEASRMKDLARFVNNEEVVDYTKRMIEIQSLTGSEEGIARHVSTLMRTIGMDVKTYEVEPGRPNVVGLLSGKTEKPTLLLTGHLDVVPAGDSKLWLSPPFRPLVRNGRLYGRGACDMKGGLASIIEAVRTVIRSGIELNGNLMVAMVVDEEISGKGTLHLVQQHCQADFAVVAEPTNLQVIIAQKGAVWFEITTRGKPIHSSMVTSSVSTINAIYKMTKVITAIERHLPILEKRKHPLVGNPTISAGTINGGTQPNVVPEICKLTVDRRLIPGERAEDARDELLSILNEITKSDPTFDYDLTVIDATHEPSLTDPGEEIVKLCRNAVKAVTGVDQGYKGFTATTDMSILLNTGKIPTVILGPGDIAQAHTVNEYVEVTELATASEIYAQLIVDTLT